MGHLLAPTTQIFQEDLILSKKLMILKKNSLLLGISTLATKRTFIDQIDLDSFVILIIVKFCLSRYFDREQSLGILN